MRLPLLFVGLALLAACESDATKLERLQGEAATAHLRVFRYQHLADSLYDTTAIAAYRDSVHQAETAAALADRDLAHFLGGR